MKSIQEILQMDDQYEEFPLNEWNEQDLPEDIWEDSWSDDDDDYGKQLRAEVERFKKSNEMKEQ